MSLFQLMFTDFLVKLHIPHCVIFLSWLIINFAFASALMIFAVLVLVLFERKYLAFFTRRKGPDRAGYKGMLQTAADGVKILFKENILPYHADKLLYFASPVIVFACALAVYALIPFSSGAVILQSGTGVILFCAVLSLHPSGVLFAGYSSSGNKYALTGALRSCIQVISAEIPLYLVIASVVVLSSSMNLAEIIKVQQNSLFCWNIFPDTAGFVIFFVCSLIILNRTPFDFPEAESELVAGYHSEYSGMKFAMFFLGEYALTFILSAFTAVLFLGGYASPFGIYFAELFNLPLILNDILINFEQFFWLILKTFIIIMLIMWVRAAYPRLKTDKTLELCWYIFIPLSLFNLILMCLVQYIRSIL